MSYNKRNFKIPDLVEPDLENGLESVSCELAKMFYQDHKKELLRMSDREDIKRLYVSTIGKWSYSKNGPGARNFKQILYSLCRDGRVCRVVDGGRKILWRQNIPKYKLFEKNDILASENRKLKQKLESLLENQKEFLPNTPDFSPPPLERAISADSKNSVSTANIDVLEEHRDNDDVDHKKKKHHGGVKHGRGKHGRMHHNKNEAGHNEEGEV